MNAEPITVETTFSAPVDAVWKAITDPDQMRKWFFSAMTDFEPRVGFETQFNVHVEGMDFLHMWKIKEVDPGRKIAYGWKYEEYPGDATVVWELSETPDGTKLSFRQDGLETFPQDNPMFTREAAQGGWDYFLLQNLPAFLDGNDVTPA